MVLGDTRLRRRHKVDDTELVAMCQYEQSDRRECVYGKNHAQESWVLSHRACFCHTAACAWDE
mgnify:CR=1 FL=1